MKWFKADFHLHSSEDHFDLIPHTACELIDRCAELQFRIIAITNHRILTYSEAWRDYAQERGMLLIRGVEAQIQGRHVVILNADEDANKLRTFEDLKAYKQANDVFTIAPHPFYLALICLRSKLYQYADLFDAVEHHHFYTRLYNPNRPAERFALQYGKPLIGNSDCHRLRQLGLTYSLVKADLNVPSVLNALRKGDVKVVTDPLSTWEAIKLVAYLRTGDVKRIYRYLAGSSKRQQNNADLLVGSS